MKIRQVALLLVLMGMLASAAYSYLYVSWGASVGFYRTNDPSIGILNESAYGVTQTLAQLIFSTDMIIDPPNPNNVAGGYVSGDDVVLDSIIVNNPSNSGEWGSFAPRDYTGAYTPGYLYGRIFQDDTPAFGENYYNSPMVTAQDAGIPPTPFGLEFNTDMVNGNGLDQTQMIPEPMSVALYGLGMLVVLHRRRRA